MGDAATIVDDVLADHPLAGFSLGVVTRDGLTDTVLRGVATSERQVGLDTVFRIGSVTKTMTALALLRQWEAGRFDLDDPVNDHLPGLELVGKPGWAAPTIRHLLTHTAGIGELSAWSDVRRPMVGLAIPVGRRGHECRGALRRSFAPRRRTRHEMGVREPRLQRARVSRRDAERRAVCRPHALGAVRAPRHGRHRRHAHRPRRRSARDGVRQPPERSRVAQGHGHRDPAGRVRVLDVARHGRVTPPRCSTVGTVS